MAIEIKKPNPLIRFFQKVELSLDSCWEWKGTLTKGGYGHFWLDGREVYAHRFAYELVQGPIPEGMELDHLCRNTSCVNPTHLEPVTHKENNLRGEHSNGRRERTHCPEGHPFDEENTYVNPRGERQCRACMREASRRYKERVRA